jgi:hypothetical protein
LRFPICTAAVYALPTALRARAVLWSRFGEPTEPPPWDLRAPTELASTELSSLRLRQCVLSDISPSCANPDNPYQKKQADRKREQPCDKCEDTGSIAVHTHSFRSPPLEGTDRFQGEGQGQQYWVDGVTSMARTAKFGTTLILLIRRVNGISKPDARAINAE